MVEYAIWCDKDQALDLTSAHIVHAQTAFDYVASLPHSTKINLSTELPCVKPVFPSMIIVGRINHVDHVFVVTEDKTGPRQLFMTLLTNIGNTSKGAIATCWIAFGLRGDGGINTEEEYACGWGADPVIPKTFTHEDVTPSSLSMPALFALAFFHVKGAQQQQHTIPPQMTRRKKGAPPPIYKYHTLKVEALDKAIRAAKESAGEGDFRAHIVRGHFKDYRKSGLGKNRAKGIYWWHPHVRGNKNIGLIAKEYEL